MPVVISVLRWLGAILLAFHVYVVTLVVFAFVWKTFGTSPLRTMEFGMALAATLGVLAGAMVVARRQRHAAALALWAFAMATPAWSLAQSALVGQFDVWNLVESLWTLSGGLLGYWLVRRIGTEQNGRDMPGHPSPV